MTGWRKAAAAAIAAMALAACAPHVKPPGPPVAAPELLADAYVAADGASLPLRVWLPEREPRAVILALHGFNDYANAFDEPAKFWRARGFATYAYDQRGFGGAPNRGYWAGSEALVDDLKAVSTLLRARHPHAPLLLLGESMGGGVIMSALADPEPPATDGVVLAAPAVWGRETMGAVKRAALWIAAHTVPWLTVTGRGLDIRPSDNDEMLRKLSLDPQVIKETRVDAVWGVVDLMDRALESAPGLESPTLILYGEKDDIIPKEPTRRMLELLPRDPGQPRRIAIYPNGYHMLTRDLQAQVVWEDVSFWLDERIGALNGAAVGAGAPLPSGADARGLEALLED
ncbi:MAG: lysophospholipase [Alphaproteobacteria bacterium]